MRRLALTIFLLLFTLSAAARTFERTEAWAAEHPRHAHRSAGFNESHKHSPHDVQTKLLEDGSVGDSASAVSSDPPHSETAFHSQLSDFAAVPNDRIDSSRAPPALV